MKPSYLKTGLYTITTIALLFSSTQNHAQQYYKWVDANGSTQYTTTPPPKNAKKHGKVDTYGWRNSAPTTSAQTAAANNTHSPTTAQTANTPATAPEMDSQQREANAALQQAQQERANPQVF